MELAINILKRVNQQHLTAEKILLMPSYSAGQKFLQLVTGEGLSLLNLRVETVYGLAEGICNNYLYRDNKTVINGQVVKLLLQQIIKELSFEQRLSYLSRLAFTPGVITAVYSSLYELRLAGYTAATLVEEHFITADKGRDIIAIMRRYEKILGDNNYLDEAELYQRAILLITENKRRRETIYFIPSDLKPSYLAGRLLKILTATSGAVKYILPGEKVAGLKAPQGFFDNKGGDAVKSTNPFAYLFDLANCPVDIIEPQVTINKAYGESNEVRQVLRVIKQKALRLDHTAVFCTTTEPYGQLFYGLACQYNLPITFGDGISIFNTAPGKLYFSLLEWVEKDYRTTVLRTILTSGIIKLAGDQRKMAAILRQSGIGRGRARYLSGLERELATSGGQGTILRAELEMTREFIAVLFKLLPGADQQGMVAGPAFVSGLSKIITDYCDCSDEIELEACALISEKLTTIAAHIGVIAQVELLTLLRELVQESRVGLSLPRAGHLHVTSFQKASYISRENIFITGLDSSRLPGRGKEDPLLLDIERKRLGGLALNSDRSAEEMYQIAGILAGLPGSLYFSFSCYDLIEDRELSPSSLLLQVYRLAEREATADYSALNDSLQETVGFIAGEEAAILDETEYWLYHLLTSEEAKNSTVLISIYPETARGIIALTQRRQGGFNQYNGRIAVERSVLDPRQNKQLISASRLELIATCPYKYFLQFILGIKAPLELEFSPISWLDPVMRGALLHRVFELFYRELAKRNEQPSLAKHREYLFKLAEGLLAEQRRAVPPPSELVFEQESAEIFQSCRVFLASEEANAAKAVPTYFELSFGLGRCDESDGIALELKDGAKISLSGRIDRIDRLAAGIYNIIDYKTGSTYQYRQSDYFKQGRQLQHALYALALEKILDQPVSVELAGYVFPALQGEGQRFLKPAETEKGRREDVREIVSILLDLISSGNFIMTDESTDCQYCDYQLICDPDDMAQISRKLRQDSEDKYIASLRRLSAFV